MMKLLLKIESENNKLVIERESGNERLEFNLITAGTAEGPFFLDAEGDTLSITCVKKS